MNPACPNCGGTRVRQITPGFFECESAIDASIPPGMAGNPTWLHGSRPCGHRFQVATAVTTEHCACGRQSIGRCQDCSQPLCGLHGTTGGAFLCGRCFRRRDEQAEAERLSRHEAAVSVARQREPVTESEPAELADVVEGEFPVERLGGAEVGMFSLFKKLWVDGLRRGRDDLLGLAWTDSHSGPSSGEVWQLVHHYTYVRRARRTVRPWLRQPYEEEYVAEELDSWTVYAYYHATGRLCNIRHFRGRELLEHWRRLENHASGNLLYDFRWEPVPAPITPTIPETVTLTATPDRSLFPQLDDCRRQLGLETWTGLSWIDQRGELRRIADDAMVQRSRGSGSPVYRALLVDSLEGDQVVDREVSEVPSIEAWIDSIDAKDGTFDWTPRA